MRLIVVAPFLGVTLGLLSGCGSTPSDSDPYSNMLMLTPEQAGVGQQVQEDPVQRAERDFNAKFAHKVGQTR